MGAVFHSPESRAAEAFDALRSSLRLSRGLQQLAIAQSIDAVREIVSATSVALADGDGCVVVIAEPQGTSLSVAGGGRRPADAAARMQSLHGWVTHPAPSIELDRSGGDDVPYTDWPQTRSIVTLPIRSTRMLGSIGLYWKQQHELPAAAFALLQGLADAAAPVIEKLLLQQELEQRVRERTAELEAAHAEVRKLAITDDLSGVLNRRGFLLLAQQELKSIRRGNAGGMLLYFDLDGLKQLNDRHGHELGDRSIAEFAAVLRGVFRESDVIGRLGGDEFCVLAIDHKGRSVSVPARLQAALDAANASPGRLYELRASWGWTPIAPGHDTDLETLLATADAAMYADKRSRRERLATPDSAVV